MPTLLFCETYIKEGTVVIGPDDQHYKVDDTRLIDQSDAITREYQLSTISGQWSNWFPFTDIVGIVSQPK